MDLEKRIIPSVPSSHWFLKAALPFRADPTGFMVEKMREFGDIFLLPVPFYDIICIQSPDYAKHILVTQNRKYKKDIATRKLKIALGNGLLTSEGEFWRRQRRIAQPAFHRERLASMADVMVQSCLKMLDKWEKLESPFDLSKEMMILTSDIAAKALFGIGIENNSEIGKALLIGMRHITYNMRHPINLPLWVPIHRNRKFNNAMSVLNGSIHNMIEQRREAPGRDQDLLAMLMEAEDEETGERMTNQQLRDECITLFSAGHETSANALTWTLYLLSQHHDIRKRLQQEVDTVLAGRIPQFSDLPKLNYTLKVIQESMRLYPPAWVIGREALEADSIDGYPIKKGDQVMLTIFALHRQEAFWPNPERFDPERFTKEAIKSRQKHAYLPFGGGPRFCIGNNFALMEMQLILPMILQRYQLDLVPDHKVEVEPLITLRPKYGMMMEKN